MESAEPSSPLKGLGSQTRRSGSTVEQMRARLHAEVADNKRAAERAGQAHTPDEGGAAHRAGTSRSHARGSETPEPQAKRACRPGGGESAVERVEGHVTDTVLAEMFQTVTREPRPGGLHQPVMVTTCTWHRFAPPTSDIEASYKPVSFSTAHVEHPSHPCITSGVQRGPRLRHTIVAQVSSKVPCPELHSF